MTALWLVAAALIEVGGDASMRIGLRGQAWGYALGTILLAAYGLLVNQPAWQFGRLLGLYIVVFFVVSQALAWGIFGERPSGGLIVGGSLIVTGGLIIQLTSR
jgi:small multidrug resistance family-3 protein